MSENYETIKRSMEGGRPNWRALVAGFAQLGIMDGDGKPPTIRGARNTWYRVKQAHEPVRAPKRKNVSGELLESLQQAAEEPAPTRTETPLADPTPAPEPPTSRPALRTAGGLKDWFNKKPVPDLPVPAFDPQETAETPAPGFTYRPSKLR